MKKTLDVTKLKMCDVVLTTADAFVSKKIRLYTDSDISHAMIYVTSHSIIDSTGNGVHAQSTQRLIWPEKCGVHVLRLKAPLSDMQKRQITNFARQKIGTQYSTFEAGSTILGGRKTASKKQFCSRLVAQAYAAAGIKLVDNPDYCSPADLLKSDLLQEIDSITMPVSEEFEKAVNNIPDTTKVMMEATNKLMEGARKRNPSLQDSNDIDAHLIANPSDDEYFAALYQDSGYLEVWEFEYKKNLWQYDLTLMEELSIPKEAKVEYCSTLVNDRGEGEHRFKVNLAGYYDYYSQYPLKTFAILLELYKKLFELHRTRKHTARAWLLTHAPELAPVIRTWDLTPHTAEWFVALSEWNSDQAEHVRQILELQGTTDVCSVCGDDPAKDYVLSGDKVPGAVYTLRLCDDCLTIRQNTGESFSVLGGR
ncbi:YiiX/YebB-like N1pC/P60 family cysteine hydrolase [Methylophilus sp. Q8]|uniref:YiiX/YebB-like N1pC/P60 family cysteine hydrolase n=1 Tax=Methylophilus sp. Q8 TaxID=1506586 RepID=UPI00137935DF|nr:YiiX/YebB-like N1pC/P60 family cysteine hydrolase [Methylophilus sp. Q8]